MRKTNFVKGEFYHIYNRGVDKRNIFSSETDIRRFLQSMDEFNSIDSIGSIYENSFRLLGRPTSKRKNKNKLVNFICYCVNPNHFHFMLEPLTDNGISEFMKRLSGGYAKYFNEKEKRSGALFQGRFKSIHINSNEYLLHLSAYINLNYKVHQNTSSLSKQLGRRTSKLSKVESISSWAEYVGGHKAERHKAGFVCNKSIILQQFRNVKEYRRFVEHSIRETIRRRNLDKLPASLLLE